MRGGRIHAMNDPVMQESQSPENSTGSNLSILVYTVIAVALAITIRMFIAAPYLVAGPSMEPTFQNSDYLIADRLSYVFSSPQRGDVIIFKIPVNQGETLIKRIVGIPGDTVSLSDDTVTITNTEHPEGVALSEPYLDHADLGGASGMEVTLAADEYFVLGDNRKVSFDSRLWGALPRKNIIGRAFVRLYPVSEISVKPGETRYSL